MPGGPLQWTRRAIARYSNHLALAIGRKLLRWRWGIELIVPAELPPPLAGQPLPWHKDRLQQLERALDRLSGKLEIRRLIKLTHAKAFLAHDLQWNRGLLNAVTHLSTQSIGLDASLFAEPQIEGNLLVLRLDVGLLHEVAHLWDDLLQRSRSPYSSNSEEWRDLDFTPAGIQRAFPVPGLVLYSDEREQLAEDWASAVLWFVFRDQELRRRSPERFEFIARLFQEFSLR